ncbi:MAG: tRNA (adenosine(37)-N6)-threonylcarbamoyltransferase complex ATPase subunit type 1 TsaE [Microbacteriaceae bacterium]
MRLTIATPEQMSLFGTAVAAQLVAGDLLALNGQLGAGKTTFTRGLGRGLDVRGAVTSPTFVLARTHPRASGAPLVHVDAYRLSNALELDDLDIDFEASIVVVEWADGMLDGVSDSWLEFRLDRPTGSGHHGQDGDDGVEPRHVVVTGFGPRWADLAWLESLPWRT